MYVSLVGLPTEQASSRINKMLVKARFVGPDTGATKLASVYDVPYTNHDGDSCLVNI